MAANSCAKFRRLVGDVGRWQWISSVEVGQVLGRLLPISGLCRPMPGINSSPCVCGGRLHECCRNLAFAAPPASYPWRPGRAPMLPRSRPTDVEILLWEPRLGPNPSRCGPSVGPTSPKFDQLRPRLAPASATHPRFLQEHNRHWVNIGPQLRASARPPPCASRASGCCCPRTISPTFLSHMFRETETPEKLQARACHDVHERENAEADVEAERNGHPRRDELHQRVEDVVPIHTIADRLKQHQHRLRQ